MIFLLIFGVFFQFSSALLVCPPGYQLISNDKCAMYGYDSVPHREAEIQCKLHGGTLYNIDNAIDNRALTTFIFQKGWTWVWIGLYCFKPKYSDCYWDNGQGTAASYHYFIENHIKPDVGCVTIYQGMWFSEDCRDEYNFVCQAPATYQDDCPHNFNGYCYLPSHEFSPSVQKKNYTDAHKHCVSLNAIPLTIHSKMEHDYIRTIYAQSSATVTQIYLGAQNSFYQWFDDFFWLDNSPWDFDFRDPLRGSKFNLALVMDVQGVGLWHEVDGKKEEFFMCKRRAGGFQIDLQKSPEATVIPTTVIPTIDPATCQIPFLLAPGNFTGPNFTDMSQKTPCSYKLVTLAPYRVGIYFPILDIAYNNITITDKYGSVLMSTGSYRSEKPTTVIAPGNEAYMTYYWDGYGHSNFEVVVLAV